MKVFFAYGPQLAKADPLGLLQGSGKMVRYVVVEKAADVERKEIEALVVAALEVAKVRVVPGAKGVMVVKVEEQKKRAVRAKKVVRATVAGRKKKARR